MDNWQKYIAKWLKRRVGSQYVTDHRTYGKA
jgi:hypothetical protein